MEEARSDYRIDALCLELFIIVGLNGVQFGL